MKLKYGSLVDMRKQCRENKEPCVKHIMNYQSQKIKNLE